MNKKNSFDIIFAGTPDFATTALAALLHSSHKIKAVYTQPDRPAGRGQKLTPSPVKQLALQHHIPVYQPVNLRDEQEQKKLKELNADVMIVVAYGLILPKAVLEAPRLGCINIHASLLPRWRGAAPIQRAILAGDQKTGITIMQMDEGLDTGAMLYQADCSIDPNDTSGILHDRLAKLGAEALIQTLDNLESISPKPQDAAAATYAQKIKKEEAQINWNLSAEEIDRQIRAFNPWPVAFTTIDDQVVRVWEAKILDRDIIEAKSIPKIEFRAHGDLLRGKPGEIMKAKNAKAIDVETGEGFLRLTLTKIQLPGGKILPVTDVLNAKHHLFEVGKILKNYEVNKKG